ncbi:MAG: alpha-galactosidase [Clostridia bacterium]|nr:alpha-galactosidase [Clostridia bacterium]
MKLSHDYFDVYYQPGANPVFCYRSGLAIYEETFTAGMLVSSGYNAAGYPLNVLSGFPSRINHAAFTEPSAFNIEIDGQSIDYDLRFVDFATEKSEDHIEAVLTLESNIKPVRLKIHTVLDGTQMFTRFIEIENLSENNLAVSRVSLLSGGLEEMDKAQMTNERDISKLYSIGYFNNDVWGREGEFVWRDLHAERTSVDTRFGRDRYRHPIFFVRNNVKGHIYFAQIAWSGGCRFNVDYKANTERDHSAISFSAEITAYSPMIVLRANENFVFPEVYMGVVAGGLDDAVSEMHAHIRKSVLCLPEADASACLVGAGMGAEHDMTVETSKSFIRQFAEMGGEIFIIDAGWQCPLQDRIDWQGFNGVNIPNEERYPNGISELADYCHEKGLKFALWVEIERLGRRSKAFEEHPDWISRDIYGTKCDGYIDFTNKEAAEWAENELARIITEYKLDLLRVDYNVAASHYFAMRDMGTGIKECISLRHFNAVYNMYRNLKKRFPNVIFENCAGGGGRTDLGMMKAFNHTWVSDWQNAPRSITITNGMTMALPPERVDRLFAGMGCHKFGSFDMQMRNIMLGHMSLNVVAPASAELNPCQMDFVKHSVDVYKSFIRGFLPNCLVYHHTPEAEKCMDEGECVLEISSCDHTKGAITVFSLCMAKKEDSVIIPKGIDLAKNYKVTLDNSGSTFTVSGYELSRCGIRVNIPSSMSSELVLYEAE